ncbi:hypothetical protein ACA910_014505 [Epithemia clementina (nom. ined.)]
MKSNRVPEELQQVLLSGAGGPPTGKLAFRTYSTRALLATSGHGKKESDDSSLESSKTKESDASLNSKTRRRRQKSSGRQQLTRADSVSSVPSFLSPQSTVLKGSSHHEKKKSPSSFLEKLLKERGYSNRKFSTLQTAYRNDPTPLQRACFHAYFLNMLMKEHTRDRESCSNLEDIQAILECGVSPNACNSMGETLVHFLCRSGQQEHVEVLQLLIKFKASVQVADDNGRTPLHEACLRRKTSGTSRGLLRSASVESKIENSLPPCFQMVDLIARIDVGLFLMKDGQGKTPLSYVSEEHWQLWIQYLDSRKDMYWPLHPDSTDSAKGSNKIPPKIKIPMLAALAPNRRPLYKPPQHLSPRQAARIASGQVQPYEQMEAVMMRRERKNKNAMKDFNQQNNTASLDSHFECAEAPSGSNNRNKKPSIDEDSYIACWINPKEKDGGNGNVTEGYGGEKSGYNDDHYADSIILGGIPLPTLRYALVNEDYAYQSGAESASRRGSETSSTFNRRLSETSFTSTFNRRMSETSTTSTTFNRRLSETSTTSTNRRGSDNSSTSQQQLKGESTCEPRTSSTSSSLSPNHTIPPLHRQLNVMIQHGKQGLPTYKGDATSISSGEATSESGAPRLDHEQNLLSKSPVNHSKSFYKQDAIMTHKNVDVVGSKRRNVDAKEHLHHVSKASSLGFGVPKLLKWKSNDRKDGDARSALDFPGHELADDNGINGASMDLSNLVATENYERGETTRQKSNRALVQPTVLDELDEGDSQSSDSTQSTNKHKNEDKDDHHPSNDSNGRQQSNDTTEDNGMNGASLNLSNLLSPEHYESGVTTRQTSHRALVQPTVLDELEEGASQNLDSSRATNKDGEDDDHSNSSDVNNGEQNNYMMNESCDFNQSTKSYMWFL